ncbi:hypothetical protein FNV43_RR22041 [Rhamnella rubrinervis]|uniref:F-box protein n=1 Tax=Rhamnella rubrinervis TaxID=2594499 RepID=A0A8K0DVE0_9ROSA|nr:hypothetical protein FNV43_RR22041 [Rhamnella rubrinervis]
MDSVPDAIFQYILSHINGARDVAVCSCVSKRWQDSLPYIRSLYFPRNSFDNHGRDSPDEVVRRMVSRIAKLEELVVYSPFSGAGLASWLLAAGSSLTHLELRMDNLTEQQAYNESTSKLDCISAAKNLKSLKLWGVLMTHSPSGKFSRNSGTLKLWEQDWRTLHCQLCYVRVQWCWDAISNMLQWASEVKHLYMKVEFTGDFDALQPFPEIDFVDFFNSHPKLQKFDIHGAMFAALCQKNSLKNVDTRFVIPCLEEVVITVRSPLNAEQKMSTLESFLKFGKNLKAMVIKILQMKSSHSSADDFFEEVCRFKYMNRKIVRIE